MGATGAFVLLLARASRRSVSDGSVFPKKLRERFSWWISTRPTARLGGRIVNAINSFGPLRVGLRAQLTNAAAVFRCALMGSLIVGAAFALVTSGFLDWRSPELLTRPSFPWDRMVLSLWLAVSFAVAILITPIAVVCLQGRSPHLLGWRLVGVDLVWVLLATPWSRKSALIGSILLVVLVLVGVRLYPRRRVIELRKHEVTVRP